MKTYFPYQIEKMSMTELHKEYSRLRSIANKRIMRLQSQGLEHRESKFPTIKTIKQSKRMSIASELADVSAFLRSDRTTVTGAKKFLNDYAATMSDMGYGDLVKSVDDIYKLIDFMEAAREKYTDAVFDSGDALDVLQQAQRLNIPYDKVLKHFDEFAINLDKLEQVKPSRAGAEFSQRRINNLIKKWSND